MLKERCKEKRRKRQSQSELDDSCVEVVEAKSHLSNICREVFREIAFDGSREKGGLFAFSEKLFSVPFCDVLEAVFD